MADEDDFKIKGAALKTDPQKKALAASDASPDDRSDSPEEGEADEQASEDAAEKMPNLADTDERLSDEEKVSGAVDLSAAYRWYKCAADESVYGKDAFYYIHADTQESSWMEPNEPFWIFDPFTGKADAAGLQSPSQQTGAREEASKPDAAATWGGYNPKIHGNYDPNADYARFHEEKRAQEAAALQPNLASHTATPGYHGDYSATMATNRFTGHAQALGAGPERHTDTAKSGRQMNAFFDVDAAANAHDGRSLKDERKAQKLTREQVKAFNQARREKKQKKRLAFYKS